jgi:hypothetical protein
MVLVRIADAGREFRGSSSCAGTGSMLQKLSMSAPNVARNLSSWL